MRKKRANSYKKLAPVKNSLLFNSIPKVELYIEYQIVMVEAAGF